MAEGRSEKAKFKKFNLNLNLSLPSVRVYPEIVEVGIENPK